MGNELKPCPFCGEPAKLYVDDKGVRVMCTGIFMKDCGCCTDLYSDVSHYNGITGWIDAKDTAVERAIKAWNRRVNDG